MVDVSLNHLEEKLSNKLFKMKFEILYNDELKNYTLEKEVNSVKSYKKVPIKYKTSDKTSKYRKEILANQIDNY